MKGRLTLPYKSRLLAAAFICAVLNLLIRFVEIQNGEIKISIPYFGLLSSELNFRTNIYLLISDFLVLLAWTLMIAAPLIRKYGVRLMALAWLCLSCEALWRKIIFPLWDGGAWILMDPLKEIFEGLFILAIPHAARGILLLLCDAGKIRGKRVLISLTVIFMLINPVLYFLPLILNMYFSVDIINDVFMAVLYFLLMYLPTILLELSLCNEEKTVSEEKRN